MSRKDYVALAEALRFTNASRDTVWAIAEVLAIDNPRFDRAKFFHAAGQ